MELKKLTSDDRKILATGKLLAYCDDKIIIEPPCHAESIFNMFYSFMHTGFSKNGETPLEKLQSEFPNIGENELMELIKYFKQVEYYCDLVCCAFAGIYPYVVIPKNDEAREDIERVVHACSQRYPWLKPEYIKDYLVGVTAMCNR